MEYIYIYIFSQPQPIHYNWSTTTGQRQPVHHNWSTVTDPSQLVHNNWFLHFWSKTLSDKAAPNTTQVIHICIIYIYNVYIIYPPRHTRCVLLGPLSSLCPANNSNTSRATQLYCRANIGIERLAVSRYNLSDGTANTRPYGDIFNYIHACTTICMSRFSAYELI